MAQPKQALWLKEVTRFIGQQAVSLVNMQRAHNQTDPMHFVQITLPAVMPPLPDLRNVIQQRLLGRSAMSLYEFETALRRIATDADVRGVVLVMNGFGMGLADLQTLRDAIVRFRSGGKKVIAYAQSYDLANYFVASAADALWTLPGGMVSTTGLVSSQVFLKDALDTVGLEADVVAVTPYKSAADQLSRTEPSPESRAQVEWLLDSNYEIMVDTIAAGRGISADAVRAMIDHAPYTDVQALEQGFIEQISNEEGFAALLDVTPDAFLTWEQADARLPLLLRFDEPYVALVSLSGTIVNGTSGQPPVDIPIPLVGGARIGDVTVVQHIRQLMDDDSAKAVVLLIDSPGGSATASEAIVSALEELAKTRPIVVVMGDVAASGGYYIATCADWIIAQPGTITGSIGVVLAKLVTTDALRKLRFNPFYYLRGENAAVFTSIRKFSDSERERMTESIARIYDLFVQRVADARKMKIEEVDAISGGRVWTGKQALANGLVDQLGGLQEGLAKARELARLPADTPVRMSRPSSGASLTAQLAEKVNPAAALNYWYSGVTMIANGQAQLLLDFELRQG